MLAYQARYNDEVVAKGEPFDTAALEYLDTHFKEQVTTALQDCLLTRPRSPLRFIAEHLQEAGRDRHARSRHDAQPLLSGKGVEGRCVNAQDVPDKEYVTSESAIVTDGFVGQEQCVLKLSDGTLCELTCASAMSEPAEQLPGVPVVRLFAPTLYDIEAAVRHLETLTPATDPTLVATIIIAEPPPAPQRIVFIGGVPYFARRYSVCSGDETASATRDVVDELDDVDETRPGTTKSVRAVAPAGGGREGRLVAGDTLSLLCEAIGGSNGGGAGAGQPGSTTEVLSWQAAMARLRTLDRTSDALTSDSSRVTVLLPSLQRNYTTVFDRIDEAVREAMHPGYMDLVRKGKFFGSFVAPDTTTTSSMQTRSLTDEHTTVALREPPNIVFLSFHKANASLTFARVLAAYVPYYERAQYSELHRCAMRDKARAAALQSDFVMRYWAEVHQRRADRDAARAAPRPATRRRRPVSAEGGRNGAAPPRVVDGSDAAPLPPSTTTLTPTPPRTQPPSSRGPTSRTATSSRPTRPPTRTRIPDETAAASSPNATVAALLSPKESKRAEQRRLARERRRQNEDSAFLDVLQALRVQAATRIQALYRGHRTRRSVRAMRADSGSVTADTAPPPPPLPRPPAALPPLLRLCLERLTSLHGSLFGNYPSTTPPAPRRLLCYRPVRCPIAAETDVGHGDEDRDDDDDEDGRERESGEEDEVVSESETWKPELLRIMPQRATRPPPHVNPLRRTLEYLRLARCTMLDEAIFVQRECGGLSLLQQRAYDELKSIALNLIHVAYTELFHRGALTLESMTLYGYMRTHLADVMGCFSRPHLVSRHVMQVSCNAAPPCTSDLAAAPASLLTSRRHQAVDGIVPMTGTLTERALRYEYVLVRGTDPDHDSDSACRSFSASIAQESSLGAEHHVVAGARATSDEAKLEDDGSIDDDVAGTTMPPRMMMTMPSACRQLCTRVYLAPAVLTAAELERTLSYVAAQAAQRATSASSPVGHGGGNELLPSDASPLTQQPCCRVAWWNACPYPLVYTDGTPLILLPRRNEQSVQGMAAFDTFVLDVTSTETQTTASTQGTKDTIQTEAEITTPHASIQNKEVSVLDGRSKVQDTVPSSPPPPRTSPRWLVHSTSCVFDTLGEDDDALQRHLEMQLRRSNGQLCYYDAPSDTASGDVATALPRRPGYRATLAAPHLRRVEQDAASLPVTARTVLQSADELVDDAANSDMAPVELEYVRPRMPFVCWVSWLYTYEAVVERLVTQLRAGSVVLLSADTSRDVVLIATAVLLARAMEAEGEGGGGGGATGVGSAGKATKARQDHTGLAFDGEGQGGDEDETAMQKRLAFFDEYYAQLQAATSRSGVHVNECVAVVQGVLRELDGGTLLREIARAQRAAEMTVCPRRRRRCILALTRLSEWYCYLVLLQVFLMMPFNRQAMRVERGGGTTLMSLRQFATTMGLMSWVEQMEPWKGRSTCCPDHTHLRYSNGLRRWDDDGYICFAAL